MAFIELYRSKLKQNYCFLDNLFKKKGKNWAVVTKLLCGNKSYIEEIIKLGAQEICDSRISNLKVVKEINPDVKTLYIKPPAKRSIRSIVKYADVSFNSEYETIKLLSDEAVKQGKIHKVVIMIELGDLREGVMGENLVAFYESVFNLPGIMIQGVGTNLNCLNGVMPSEDKLIQLSLYEQLIEAKFNKKIPCVTGGTSVILPLLLREHVPMGVNHFRIGETLFFGNNLISGEMFEGMAKDVIKLFAEVIEISEKPVVPIGYLGENPSGETHQVDEKDFGKTMRRAIVDIGLLDMSIDYLIPDDRSLKAIGASSDMLVIDISDSEKDYKVGDLISFSLKYMGALRLFSSDYIEKKMV